MLKFIHEFEEDPPLSDLTVDLNLPAGALAGVRLDGHAVLLYANSAGFTHLAKIFAEIGARDLEEEYHFHVGPDFESGGEQSEFELTVMKLSRRLPLDEKRVRME
ncbi:MAG: hypothetical protein WBQ17_17575 [Rhizomicrobium sp.]